MRTMNKRFKNLLIILLLLLVNIVGYYAANNYFNNSAGDHCETARGFFADWLGAKASIEHTARWIVSLVDVMKFFKGV